MKANKIIEKLDKIIEQLTKKGGQTGWDYLDKSGIEIDIHEIEIDIQDMRQKDKKSNDPLKD